MRLSTSAYDDQAAKREHPLLGAALPGCAVVVNFFHTSQGQNGVKYTSKKSNP
jgi:hypothetical protein